MANNIITTRNISGINNKLPSKTVSDLNNNINKIKSTTDKAKLAAEKASNIAKKTRENIIKNQNKINNTKQSIEKTKESFDSLKNTVQNVDIKSLLNPKEILNNTDIFSKLMPILLPLLSKFINIDKSNNVILDNIIKSVKKQFEKKGRVEIRGSKILFTPNKQENLYIYENYKATFSKKIVIIQNNLKFLKTVLDGIIILLKVFRIIIAAEKIRRKIKKAKTISQSISSTTELSTPSPFKPNTGVYILSIEKRLNEKKEEDDKLDKLIGTISFITTILQILKKLISDFNAKLKDLSVEVLVGRDFANIISDEINQITSLSDSIINDTNNTSSINNTSSTNNTSSMTYTSTSGRTYTVEVIEPSPGIKQAIAYDSFSKMKITQTAPSKSRTNSELLDELKQILG